MTDQEINIAIAEACGWKRNKYNSRFFTRPDGASRHELQIPNYVGDLNAMHEAEETLFDDPHEACVWYGHLANVVHCKALFLSQYDWPSAGYRVAHATARQRAEAFLRTTGKTERVNK